MDRYFSNQCTEKEKELVENWILNKDNQAPFEQYIQDRWDTFDIAETVTSTPVFSLRKTLLKVAAVVAVLGFTGLLSYKTLNNNHIDTKHLHVINTSTKPLTPETGPSTSPQKGEVLFLPKEEKKVIAKTKTISKPNLKIQDHKPSKDDSVKVASLKATKIQNIKINEKLLSELSSQIDSNKLVLTMNMNEERFKEISTLLKDKYHIVLVPVSEGGEKNLYAARFEKTDIADLLKTMQSKMAFTYDLKDSVLFINL